jgi:hypothetical protein
MTLELLKLGAAWTAVVFGALAPDSPKHGTHESTPNIPNQHGNIYLNRSNARLDASIEKHKNGRYPPSTANPPLIRL